jgi:hypothetical protein
MKIDYNSIKLSKNDLFYLNKTIGKILNNFKLTDKELINYWEILPNNIKSDVLYWGFKDKLTKIKISEWFKINYINN